MKLADVARYGAYLFLFFILSYVSFDISQKEGLLGSASFTLIVVMVLMICVRSFRAALLFVSTSVIGTSFFYFIQ